MAKATSGFRQVVKALELSPKQPASKKAIAEFETKTGLKLPPEIREIYEACNGLKFKQGELEILSLGMSLTWVDAFRREGVAPAFGYLPFAESNDSNPFCVCCSGPMAGLVVRVFHDDSPRLMFRSVDSFFKWILTLETEEDWLEADDLWPGEFADSKRTKKDLAQAKKIMEWAEKLSESDQTNARRFAITIHSEESMDDIIAQLDANDTYVREEAERSLQKMNHPKAEAAIAEYQKSFKLFAKKCVGQLNKGGVAAELLEAYGRPAIKVTAGKKFRWLNVQGLYGKRNDSDFWDYLLKVTKQILRR